MSCDTNNGVHVGPLSEQWVHEDIVFIVQTEVTLIVLFRDKDMFSLKTLQSSFRFLCSSNYNIVWFLWSEC